MQPRWSHNEEHRGSRHDDLAYGPKRSALQLDYRRCPQADHPPVALQQFRIWQVEHQPVGFVTWGLFNEETEAGYLAGSRKIQPDDWNAGDRLWLVDFIAPFGGVSQLVRVGRQHLRSVLGKGVLGRANREHRGKLWSAVT